MASSIDNVPANSKLELWSEGTDGDYETPASLVAGDPAGNRRWSHEQLVNSSEDPPFYTLSESGAIYIIRFFTKFNTSTTSTAKLVIRVLNPQGEVVGQTSEDVSGKRADDPRIDFFGVSVA